jgi:ataxin-10
VNLSTTVNAELLRLLEAFLPRINFGKPVISPGNRDRHATATHDITGFSYLKRDLVRLLGILCHTNRVVQDKVRDCGGIEIVMGLCIVDDRNPCGLEILL